MAKNSVSEWSTVSSGNGDIAGITLGLDMPPSYVNNAMQEMMAQIKQWKDGYTDPLTGVPVYQSIKVENIDIEGIANFKGGLKLNGSYGNNGQVLVSRGSSATPTWGSGFPTGGIIMWSGSVATIPSGWALCNGANGTPNLRNKFILGAYSDTVSSPYPNCPPHATGGYEDATLPAHNHTASTSVATKSGLDGTLTLLNRGGNSGSSSLMANSSGSITRNRSTGSYGAGWQGEGGSNSSTATYKMNHNHSASTSVNSSGTSGTYKNVPLFYSLAYIMKL